MTLSVGYPKRARRQFTSHTPLLVQKMDALKDQDPDLFENLQKMVDEGKTYEQISDTLRMSHTSVTRGLSARSVRRFCALHGKKGPDLDLIISQSVSEVSYKYV